MGHEQKSFLARQASSLQEMGFYLNWWLWSKSSRKQTLLKMPANWKFPERSLQKHQNTVPMFPSLRLISDIVSGDSSSICERQLHARAMGAPKTLWLWCSLDAEDCPGKPAQSHNSTSGAAGALAVLLQPSLLALPDMEIKVELKLPGFSCF